MILEALIQSFFSGFRSTLLVEWMKRKDEAKLRALIRDELEKFVRSHSSSFPPMAVMMLWLVRLCDERRGPGPNSFSASSENVRVDSRGHLHMTLTYRGNKWYCAEVSLAKPLGYGIYDFFVIGRFDQFDPQVVGGLFDRTMDLRKSLSRANNRTCSYKFVVVPGTATNAEER